MSQCDTWMQVLEDMWREKAVLEARAAADARASGQKDFAASLNMMQVLCWIMHLAAAAGAGFTHDAQRGLSATSGVIKLVEIVCSYMFARVQQQIAKM